MNSKFYRLAKTHYQLGWRLRRTPGATAEQCVRFWKLSDRWLTLAGLQTAAFWRVKDAKDTAVQS